MLNEPVPELRNRSAVVLRKSSIITASDTLASGISTLVSATTSGLSADGSSSRSEEHTSELQSLMRISYAVFCLKKKINCNKTKHSNITQPHATDTILLTS